MRILFDIGGTHTRIALTQVGDSFETPVIFETPQIYAEGIAKIISTIEGLVLDKKVTSIVGGIAGIVDREKGELVSSHNLPDWAEKPLSADLISVFGVNVFLENDSAMVALGEAHFGSGKDFSIVAYITISTGVGGARIVDGAIDEHITGFEPGQQIIDVDGTIFGNGKSTNLGDYISGKAVELRTGKKPSEITDTAFWDDLAKTLAYGLNNTIVHWSPSVVVLGGSMMNDVGIPIDVTDKYLSEIMTGYDDVPPLTKASLGDLGGLYGALAYSTQKNVQ